MYIDSFERFDEDHLPQKEGFYSKLHESHISDEDNAHAQLMWNTFHIGKMGEYHHLYIKSMLMSPSQLQNMTINDIGSHPLIRY